MGSYTNTHTAQSSSKNRHFSICSKTRTIEEKYRMIKFMHNKKCVRGSCDSKYDNTMERATNAVNHVSTSEIIYIHILRRYTTLCDANREKKQLYRSRSMTRHRNTRLCFWIDILSQIESQFIRYEMRNRNMHLCVVQCSRDRRMGQYSNRHNLISNHWLEYWINCRR